MSIWDKLSTQPNERLAIVYGRRCAIETKDFPIGLFPRSVALLFGALVRSIDDAEEALK